MYTREEVLSALRHVNDPDFKKDLVSLNMIRDVTTSETKIGFKVMLTTPACPMKDTIERDCINAIHHFIDDSVDVAVEFDSEVSSTRSNKADLLPGVKNIIAVASGKGGVGKSTVSVNLAIQLAKTGAKVGLIDADIYGPSIPVMLGLKGYQPEVVMDNDKKKLVPATKYGIKTLSIGFLTHENQALVWRGPMASGALRQLISDATWGELDYLVIDLPPGTGDIQLTLVQTVPITGAVIVTTPQEVALADVRRAVGMFSQNNINVPILGIVENMAWFTPEELPNNKYYLFGKEGGKRLAEQLQLPLLGQIPIFQGIQEGSDTGNPITTKDNPIFTAPFVELAGNVAQRVAIRNASAPPSEKVELKH